MPHRAWRVFPDRRICACGADREVPSGQDVIGRSIAPRGGHFFNGRPEGYTGGRAAARGCGATQQTPHARAGPCLWIPKRLHPTPNGRRVLPGQRPTRAQPRRRRDDLVDSLVDAPPCTRCSSLSHRSGAKQCEAIVAWGDRLALVGSRLRTALAPLPHIGPSRHGWRRFPAGQLTPCACGPRVSAPASTARPAAGPRGSRPSGSPAACAAPHGPPRARPVPPGRSPASRR